jgi:hypothetical protein
MFHVTLGYLDDSAPTLMTTTHFQTCMRFRRVAPASLDAHTSETIAMTMPSAPQSHSQAISAPAS